MRRHVRFRTSRYLYMPVQHDQQPILPGRITVMSTQDKTNVMKRLVNLNIAMSSV